MAAPLASPPCAMCHGPTHREDSPVGPLYVCDRCGMGATVRATTPGAQQNPFPSREPRTPHGPDLGRESVLGHYLAVLAIDPGQHTGLALVRVVPYPMVLGTWPVMWRGPQDARGHDMLREALSEVRGQMRLARLAEEDVRLVSERPRVAAGGARMRVDAWVGLGTYRGRVDEALCMMFGRYPEDIGVGDWRARLPIRVPRGSTSEAVERRKAALVALARTVPGCPEALTHDEAEAVCMGRWG